ncbi:hypothetical protein AO1008_06763 [Aspergillus oryzae 100-8]|uniref:Enoyl-CoA hydratase/isomerase n=1 Tax=Aspergillus oryzae (strain 3.042) TaxID=1160506 RepID=I7ZXH9_ASPO3|nr:hypothetical protein Ao3042_07034 [Aspergillus oryzae 3.042]KDE80283.1 hypothetical protein AO1008_06763 [Aspergillus oryzae 100-8]|eukprot:EIT76877.1 hypothetical protein Ao3042_07034 [Aspergillus oryzae 3.042]
MVALIRGKNWGLSVDGFPAVAAAVQQLPHTSELPQFILLAFQNHFLLGYSTQFYDSKMPPRLPLSHTLRQPSVLSVRVRVTRFSTSADDPVIQTQQIPAPGSGNIRVLLLNRPKARNAISKNLLDGLSKHVQSISAEGGNGPTRALVIASNVDSAFCAGADLKERVNMTKQE